MSSAILLKLSKTSDKPFGHENEDNINNPTQHPLLLGTKFSPVLFQVDAQMLILAYIVFMDAATSNFQ